MYTEVQKIKDWIKTHKLCTMDEHMAFYSEKAKWEYAILSKLEAFIDNMDASRVVDKGLEEAIINYIGYAPEIDEDSSTTAKRVAIRFGAKWQLEKIKEVLLSEVLPCFMHGGEADEVVAKLDEVLNKKK